VELVCGKYSRRHLGIRIWWFAVTVQYLINGKTAENNSGKEARRKGEKICEKEGREKRLKGRGRGRGRPRRFGCR